MQHVSQVFKLELLKLEKREYVDKKILDDCLKQLKENVSLTRDTNPVDHFCAFFVPINLESKSIFMGHHKKANAWAAPGGHIDEDETPVETVKREFFEELNYKLQNEKIELFDITKIYINSPNYPCKVHRDFWYIVFVDKIDFEYDKKEFYVANWIQLQEARKLNKFREFNKVYEALETKYT